MNQNKKKIELSSEINDEFILVGKPVSGHFIDPKFGEVNLRKLTAIQAKKLVEAGFPYLRLKQKDK